MHKQTKWIIPIQTHRSRDDSTPRFKNDRPLSTPPTHQPSNPQPPSPRALKRSPRKQGGYRMIELGPSFDPLILTEEEATRLKGGLTWQVETDTDMTRGVIPVRSNESGRNVVCLRMCVWFRLFLLVVVVVLVVVVPHQNTPH